MKSKGLVQIFSLLLAFNFAGEVLLSTSVVSSTPIEIEFDGDGEKKEAKKEKESDKMTQRNRLSKFEKLAGDDLVAIHSYRWWKSPTIEKCCPPPELG